MAKQEYLGESDVRGVASFAEPELTRPMPPNKGERGGLNAIRYEYPQCCMRRGFDGKQIICFDNAATSLVPKTVMAQSMLYAMLASANVHRGLSDISELSTNALEHSRSTAEDFINAPRGSVILAPNMTYGMNQVLYGVAEYMLEQGLLKKGDTITTSRAEHSSTILPFQQLSRWYGLKLNYMGVGRSGEVFVDIPEQSRIVSVVHASNVTGRVTDMRDVIEKITSNRNSNPNQFLIVDGAQALPHMPVDVQKIGCDAYVGAGHKIAGGAITPVYLDPRWHGVIPPVITGGGIPEDVGENKAELKTGPEGYEPGTPMVDAAVRLDAGIRFRVLAGLTWLETDEKRRDNLFSKSGGYEGFSGLRGQELVTALRRHLYGDPREPTEVMDEFTSALREGKQLKAGDWLRLDKGEPIPYEVSSYAMGNLHAHEMAYTSWQYNNGISEAIVWWVAANPAR